MSNVAEGAGLSSDMEGALFAGLDTIAKNQVVTFNKYTKYILPLDGYVFWLRSGSVKAKGSIHYASTRNQREDETLGINRIIFSSEKELTEFNQITPDIMFIGEFATFKFAFAERREFFEAAGVHHYMGVSVYPALQTQLIDNVAGFDNTSVIVSNSMPIWLGLNNYPMPVWYPWTAFPTIYPSFISPENLVPPYITAHIQPETTEALEAVPAYDANYTHTQLVSETVRFTLYGMRNQQALDFQDFLYQYSLDYDVFGLMNTPVMRDEKREQVEIAALAQKKTFTMQISYRQSRVNDIARQLILSATCIFAPTQDYPFDTILVNALGQPLTNARGYPIVITPG